MEIFGIVNMPAAHNLKMLSSVCFDSHSEKHTCFSIQMNDFIGIIQDTVSDTNSQVSQWLENGDFHSVNNDQQSYSNQRNTILTQFNKCSLLPIIKMFIHQSVLTAIIDSGASKSLISTSLADKIWGNNWNKNCTNQCFHLHDVNNNPLITFGCLKVDMKIGNYQFKQEFVVYSSQSCEILIGFDFLKQHKIGIFPNLGLVFENSHGIFKLGLQDSPIFPLLVKEEFTLGANAQQLITVKLDITNNERYLQILSQSVLIVHSEELEPNLSFSQLSVYFQYVTFNSYLEAEILIINNENMAQFYKKKSSCRSCRTNSENCTRG